MIPIPHSLHLATDLEYRSFGHIFLTFDGLYDTPTAALSYVLLASWLSYIPQFITLLQPVYLSMEKWRLRKAQACSRLGGRQ